VDELMVLREAELADLVTGLREFAESREPVDVDAIVARFGWKVADRRRVLTFIDAGFGERSGVITLNRRSGVANVEVRVSASISPASVEARARLTDVFARDVAAIREVLGEPTALLPGEYPQVRWRGPEATIVVERDLFNVGVFLLRNSDVEFRDECCEWDHMARGPKWMVPVTEWDGFTAGLADELLRFGGGSVLVVEEPGEPARSRFAQFFYRSNARTGGVDNDRLVAEVVNGQVLEEPVRPTEDGERAIGGAGWGPLDEGVPYRYSLAWPATSGQYGDVAHKVVTALRDGYGIADPSGLVYRAWGPEGRLELPGLGLHHSHAVADTEV
jgi:hypothetical protein